MNAPKQVVVNVTCKDADGFRAQQAELKDRLANLCPIKEVRILRANDGVFWVQAVEGKSGQDLCFFSLTIRDAYVGVLFALWLWHYGPAATEFDWSRCHGKPQLWISRLMRWVAVVSRWAHYARCSASSGRSRRAEP